MRVEKSITVKTNIELKENNVLSLDPEGFGQNFFVKDILLDYEYIISLITLDDKEEIDLTNFDGKTPWYIIAYTLEDYNPYKLNTAGAILKLTI